MAVRWLPAVILASLTVASGAVAVQMDGTPRAAPDLEGPRSPTPVFSLRRDLEPLRRRAADRTLRAELDTFVAALPADTCLTVRVDGLAYDHRADDPQTPASLQKLATAVAVLTELGAEATFVTEALASPIVDGVVTGDLYLRGGADPILAIGPYAARERNQPQIFTDFDRLADSIVAAGITTVAGNVIGDESRFDTERYNPRWPSRFLSQGQIGPITALSLNDGFAYFPDDTSGTFGAAGDPAGYAATILIGALRARGVEVVGIAGPGIAPPEATSVATLESPPVRDIVTQMLRESDNNTAEILLKELGRVRTGEGTFAAGQTAVAAILGEAGIDIEGLAVADGSGLAAEDVVSCDLVVDLLDHQPTAAAIRDSLAVAGVNGTLARRWTDTDLVGRVRAKTGTLNQVTGLAGLVDPADTPDAVDPRVARFSLIVNLPSDQFIEGETVAAQQQLAELLAAHPALPDVDRLRPGADDGD